MVADQITPDPRHFSIRLPRPLWIGMVAAVLVVAAIALRIGVLTTQEHAAIQDIGRLSITANGLDEVTEPENATAQSTSNVEEGGNRECDRDVPERSLAPRSVGNDADSTSRLSVDSIVERYERACNRLSSFDVYLTHHSRILIDQRNNEPDERQRVKGRMQNGKERRYERINAVDGSASNGFATTRQSLFNGRSRVELLTSDSATEISKGTVTVWNGKKARKFMPLFQQGQIQPNWRTFSGPSPDAYVNFYKSFNGELHYPALFRERSSRRVERQGRTFVLVADPEPERDVKVRQFGFRLTLDPERGFLPIKIDIRYGDDPTPRIRYGIELAEINPGLWVPERARIGTIFWMDRNSPFYGEDLGEKTIELDREKSRFNVLLDESLFELKFPAATHVFDMSERTAYTVGVEDSAVCPRP